MAKDLEERDREIDVSFFATAARVDNRGLLRLAVAGDLDLPTAVRVFVRISTRRISHEFLRQRHDVFRSRTGQPTRTQSRIVVRDLAVKLSARRARGSTRRLAGGRARCHVRLLRACRRGNRRGRRAGGRRVDGRLRGAGRGRSRRCRILAVVVVPRPAPRIGGRRRWSSRGRRQRRRRRRRRRGRRRCRRRAGGGGRGRCRLDVRYSRHCGPRSARDRYRRGHVDNVVNRLGDVYEGAFFKRHCRGEEGPQAEKDDDADGLHACDWKRNVA